MSSAEVIPNKLSVKLLSDASVFICLITGFITVCYLTVLIEISNKRTILQFCVAVFNICFYLRDEMSK